MDSSVPLLLFVIVQLIIDSLLINPFAKKAKKYAKEMYESLVKDGVTGQRCIN